MNYFTSKTYLGLLAVGWTALSIQLFPISKQASSWNRYIRKTSETLSQVKAVMKMNDQSKEVLSVMICNGAVFEPQFKTNFQQFIGIYFLKITVLSIFKRLRSIIKFWFMKNNNLKDRFKVIISSWY